MNRTFRRQLVVLAGCLTMLTSALATAAPAAPPTPKSWVVRGRAGDTATLTLSQPLRLGNGGADTTSTSSDGSWSGVAVLRPWQHARDAAYYVAVDIPESVRCPGGSWPYPGGWAKPPVVSHRYAADGGIMFAPGRYTIVLLRTAGSTVSRSDW